MITEAEKLEILDELEKRYIEIDRAIQIVKGGVIDGD